MKKKLIDVNPPEYFEEKHIVGAKNACVYEIVFLQNVAKIAKKSDPILVYGPTSEEGKFAAKKLKNAGYKNVNFLIGGIEKYKGKVVRGKKVAPPPIPDKSYKLSSGTLKWIGRAIGNQHHGLVRVTKGNIALKKEKIMKAHFEVDMDSIVDIDLLDKKYNKMLVNHLKSDDFFDVAKYPKARFSLLKAKKLKSDRSKNNYLVKGNLEMRGKKNPVAFEMSLFQKEKEIIAEAHFDIDRTKWGIIYGSSLLKNLGMHALKNTITLDFQLHFK